MLSLDESLTAHMHVPLRMIGARSILGETKFLATPSASWRAVFEAMQYTTIKNNLTQYM